MYAQYIQKPKDVPEKTDLKNWRLDVDKGRQVWRYVSENAERLQRVCEKYFLGLDISEDCPPLKVPTTPLESARNAIDFYSKIQTEDGHWANDYGGPLFLLPGLVITCYISKTLFEEPQKKEMIRYLSNIQHEDGGWGLHLEDKSTIFGTAMNYVALRLLGLERDDERIKKAREFLHNNDGAKGIPSWGKFWLCALGVYEWEGMNAVPPELWLLPNWLPMHPGRWWCHCRVVYLPMGYIYGKRARPEPTPLILSLREELYTEPYDKIKWSSLRGYVSSLDVYTPHSTLNKITFSIVNFYESFHSTWIREKALSLCIDHIRQEDTNTKHIDIGPVNKVINMLSIFWDEGPESENFKKHQERVKDYLWLSSDGMKMQGYNGSQLWDTAFSVQAIIETGLSEEFKETMIKASKFVDCAQVLEDVQDKEKYYRHISKGAWPFSTRDHGWPISDCTAEGLKASLLLKKHCKFTEPLEDQRLYDAVNVILSLQNKDGGWATYELKRGPDWVELLNPAEVFYGIMVDYSYVECTSACVQALCLFKRFFPHHRSEEIKKSIQRGIDFILGIQRKDGSWLGSWAVCFTYAIWFGVEALVDFGHEYETSEPLQKAFKFLLEKQNKDGGWGETFQSCVKKEWCQNDKSQVVNTSWVVLSLLKANYHQIDSKPIDRAIDFLMKSQEKNGDWTQEDIKGVFNANCAISYSGYKNIFPIWALGRYNRKCGKKFGKSNL